MTKLKAFADNKLNVAKMMIFLLNRVEKSRKHCGKKRKCWLPAFSPFPTMFSKAFFSLESSEVGIRWKRVKIRDLGKDLSLGELSHDFS